MSPFSQFLFRTRSLFLQVFGCETGKLLLSESAPGQVKKILTGDLNAPVVTQPYFPGKEDHLLRAMIADISANTILAPAGHPRYLVIPNLIPSTKRFYLRSCSICTSSKEMDRTWSNVDLEDWIESLIFNEDYITSTLTYIDTFGNVQSSSNLDSEQLTAFHVIASRAARS